MPIYPDSYNSTPSTGALEASVEASIDITELVTVDEDPRVYSANNSGEFKQVLPELEEDDFSFPDRDAVARIPRPKSSLPNAIVVNFDDPLPLNIIPESRQAKTLGWTIKETKLANQLSGVFTQLPMICKGTEGCEYAKICPVINRDQFIGSSCPLELMEIYKHFVAFTRELGVRVEDHTDLLSVADLCRLYLQVWRTDMSIRLQGELVREVAGTNIKTGAEYYKQSINQNRVSQQQARASIDKIYRQLLSTREQKMAKKLNTAEAITSVSTFLSELTGFNNKANR